MKKIFKCKLYVINTNIGLVHIDEKGECVLYGSLNSSSNDCGVAIFYSKQSANLFMLNKLWNMEVTWSKIIQCWVLETERQQDWQKTQKKMRKEQMREEQNI